MTTDSVVLEPDAFRKIVNAQLGPEDKQRLLIAIQKRQPIHFTGRGLGKTTLAYFIASLDEEKLGTLDEKEVDIPCKTELWFVDHSCDMFEYTLISPHRPIFESSSYREHSHVSQTIASLSASVFIFSHYIADQDKSLRWQLYEQRDQFIRWIHSLSYAEMDCDS